MVVGLTLIGLWYWGNSKPLGFVATVILNFVVVFFMIHIARSPKSVLNSPRILLNEIMDKKKTNIDEIRNEWFRGEKIMNYKPVGWSIMLIGIFVLILGTILVVIYLPSFNQIALTISFAIMSFGLAVYSIGSAYSSNKKMTALAELNFVEKNATICNYIVNVELKVGDIERIIRDLEAGYKVIEWVKDDKTKINYIDALINLTKHLLDNKILQNVGESFKKDYKKILEDSKRFKHRVNDIEIAQENF